MLLTLPLTLIFACAEQPSSTPAVGETGLADVVAVEADGSDGALTMSVSILSPDTGCDRYADWWEVLSPSGTLHFRRILNHSHPDEQPFARSGSPVPVSGSEEIIVRAHLSPDGYGGAAMQGSIEGGFASVVLAADFAASVEDDAPQPEGCAF